MKTKIQHILILAFAVIISSCLEEYPVVKSSYDNLLVVDGVLHNASDPCRILLSHSASVDAPEFFPVKFAAVKIMDYSGNITTLEETEAGVYETDTSEFRGIAGRSYKLNIILANGKTYESSYIKLNEPAVIDSVYSSFESIPTTNPEYDKPGFRFYVNTGSFPSDTAYLLWRLSESYKYHAAFQLQALFDKFSQPYFKPVDNIDSLYYCYASSEIPFFAVETTADKNTSTLDNIQLNHVSTESKQLSMRYSLLVKQYSINKEAYEYWKAVKEQLLNDNTLFNRQAYQLRGNVYNINDPSEPVLGYFTVGGRSTKRIYMDKPENMDIPEPDCGFLDARELLYSGPADWPMFIGINAEGDAGPAEKHCVDCRMLGGKLEKPDFWKDE